MKLPLLRAPYYALFLDKLELTASVGINAEERRGPQAIEISVILIAEMPARIDSITDVVDYSFLHSDITEMTTSGHIDLLETLARDILIRCTDHKMVEGAIVRVEKTALYDNARAVGCELAHIPDRCLAHGASHV